MIHPSAIIDPTAHLAKDVSVGPYSIIGPHVSVDAGTVVGPHVVIKSHTKLGKNNKIFQFASIGEDPQDISYHGEETYLEIGDGNVIREGVTINRGSGKEKLLTKLGDNNLLMAYTHVAHDCVIENNVILANMSTLGGHVHIGSHAILGGGTLVHQFVHVGEYAFTGGGTGLMQDIPPYVLAKGNPGTPRSLNVVGLRRARFSTDVVSNLKQAYRILFREGLTLEEAVQQIEELCRECPELKSWPAFIRDSTRGLARP